MTAPIIGAAAFPALTSFLIWLKIVVRDRPDMSVSSEIEMLLCLSGSV